MHVIFTVEHVEQNVSVAQENKHDKLKTLINETVAPQALPIARRLPLHPHAQTDQYIRDAPGNNRRQYNVAQTLFTVESLVQKLLHLTRLLAVRRSQRMRCYVQYVVRKRG